MKSANNTILKLLCILLLATAVAEADSTKTAAELIKQAHKHDNMYTPGPEASQQKALSFYGKALKAKPDDSQRLHILFRMAQLYGSSYRIDKGERPNHRKAISLYEQIVESYPPHEAKVVTAMGLLSDHHRILGEYEIALTWARKILEHDTSKVEEQIKAIEQQAEALESDSTMSRERQQAIVEEYRWSRSLKRTLNKIRGYQKLAVDRVARSAGSIDPLRAHGELRAIAEKHNGTAIGERAAVLLAENMNKWPDLWAPDDNVPFSPDDTALQAAAPGPAGLNQSQSQAGIKAQLDVPAQASKGSSFLDPNTDEKREKSGHNARQPRAPPLGQLSGYIIAAAGFIVLGLAALVVNRKLYRF